MIEWGYPTVCDPCCSAIPEHRIGTESAHHLIRIDAHLVHHPHHLVDVEVAHHAVRVHPHHLAGIKAHLVHLVHHPHHLVGIVSHLADHGVPINAHHGWRIARHT